MTRRIVALLPMRHRSERVPGKNYRKFGGVPLYHHIVKTLLKCGHFDRIIIDTDSPIIIEDVVMCFPKVDVFVRPEHLRDGKVSMNAVISNTITKLDTDFYFQTHSTNPLLTSDTIDKALTSFFDLYPMYDSMFAVTRLQTRLWDELARAVNHNPNILLRTQDLSPIFEENSNFYLFTKEQLLKGGSRIGRRPMMFEVNKVEALDIDVEQDFLVGEFLYKRQ